MIVGLSHKKPSAADTRPAEGVAHRFRWGLCMLAVVLPQGCRDRSTGVSTHTEVAIWRPTAHLPASRCIGQYEGFTQTTSEYLRLVLEDGGVGLLAGSSIFEDYTNAYTVKIEWNVHNGVLTLHRDRAQGRRLGEGRPVLMGTSTQTVGAVEVDIRPGVNVRDKALLVRTDIVATAADSCRRALAGGAGRGTPDTLTSP